MPRPEYRNVNRYRLTAVANEIILGCVHEGCPWEREIGDEISIKSITAMASNHEREDHT